MELDRRSFLRASMVGGGLIAVGGSALTACTPPVSFEAADNGTPFLLGVMSGLHAPDAVVLWTRLDPDRASGVSSIEWTVGVDPTLSTVLASGSVAVSADGDWCAKVLVDGLSADRSYWFRFSVPGAGTAGHSPIGRARTLPESGSEPAGLRLVFASCQNWKAGYYNAWDGIASEDIDAVVWLGDYIYESGSGRSPLDVRTDPVGTADDLNSYRAKYRLYRGDPSLQSAHQRHPFVPIWDDHELKNNYSRLDIVADPARATAAYRAWFDYMPVWPIDGTRIHRTLRWGRLAELFLLDTRQYRDGQAGGDPDSFFGSGPAIAESAQPGRTILGTAQRDELLAALDAAQDDSVRWKLIANQVMISPVRLIDLDTPELRALDPNLVKHNGLYLNMDSWDSYHWERDLIMAHLADHPISDVSFLTGDIHTFWQSTMRADFDDDSSPLVANEFVSGSISSTGFNLAGPDVARAIEPLALGWNPAFRYVDFRRNGYGLLTAGRGGMSVTYRTTDVKVRGAAVSSSVRFDLMPGEPTPAMTGIAP